MKATLRALLTGIIDYAGMFPPASLPLEQSIRNYLRYLAEPESWMLGRFICPAVRLHELTPYLAEVDSAAPVRISALGKGGESFGDFMHSHAKDTEAVLGFRDRNQGKAIVDAYEVRLPLEYSGLPIDCVEGGSAPSMPEVRWFIEAPNRPDSPEMSRVFQVWKGTDSQTGFKYRCGGTEPTAFSSPHDLARVIEICCEVGRPLKFTAGLHHPIRHFNAAAGVTMHGFINVFVAALLHKTHRVPAEPILADEDASHFVFTDTAVRWMDFQLSFEAMRFIRQFRDKVVSFGSCSFDEPRDDLRKLGWLP